MRGGRGRARSRRGAPGALGGGRGPRERAGLAFGRPPRLLTVCSGARRSEQPGWDYHAEIQAFSRRLQEDFSLDLLKTAFVNPCYVQSEEARRRQLGLEAGAAALALRDNGELCARGLPFARSQLGRCLQAAHPALPAPGTAALVAFLTGPELVAEVSRGLALQDLALCAQFPVPPPVLHRTFFAVVGALLGSSGPERTGIFLRVSRSLGGFVCFSTDKRRHSICGPRKLQEKGQKLYVGLYCDARDSERLLFVCSKKKAGQMHKVMYLGCFIAVVLQYLLPLARGKLSQNHRIV